LWGTYAQGELTGPVGIFDLVPKADVIFLGTITAGKQSHEVATLSVHTERVIKGAVSAGSAVSISWQSPTTRGYPDFDVSGDRGIFFAQTDAAGRLTMLSADVNPFEVRNAFFPLPTL
jgi:hypothetical protein